MRNFRGKRVDNGEWIYGFYVEIISKNHQSNIYYNDRFYEVIRDTVGQYIGIEDRNGREICKGDIVIGYFNIYTIEDSIWLCLTQKEKEECSKVFYIEDIFYPYTNPLPENIEIIGNIYENPELLENNNEKE